MRKGYKTLKKVTKRLQNGKFFPIVANFVTFVTYVTYITIEYNIEINNYTHSIEVGYFPAGGPL
jgi:hypothetical protein